MNNQPINPVRTARRRVAVSECALHVSGRLLRAGAATLLSLALFGCGTTPAAKPAPPLWPTLPPKSDVPSYMVGTVWERTDPSNTEPYHVSGYGLVVNLHGTGDNTNVPGTIRSYMVKQMEIHGWGTYRYDRQNQTPDDVLRDNNTAIVQVDGYLPPGARSGQRFDVQVSAVRDSGTSSLAHGNLYDTELRYLGAVDPNSGGRVLALAQQGQIFVNPAYALQADSPSTSRESLTHGVVLDSGIVQQDRPLFLQLRTPQRALARAIEYRINQRFQNYTGPQAAQAQDEGIVELYVPDEFHGDWRHFLGVATHVYMNPTKEFAIQEAQKLVDAAQKPGAALQDISYCWEALGLADATVPIYSPLMDSDKPEIAFAAARAAALVGDEAGQDALLNMARSQDYPFQLAAVQTLGELPPTPAIDEKLRSLLDSDQTLVRLAAYRILADSHDARINTIPLASGSFVLDIVNSDGPPLIYVSRQGLPRIALFGSHLQINLPITFAAIDNRLTISSSEGSDQLSIYYRDPELPDPVKLDSTRDLPVLIARLGGEGAQGESRLNFSYGDVVAILQAMVDDKYVSGAEGTSAAPVAFAMQEISAARDSIYNAPVIAEARPQTDARPAALPTTAPSGQ
jgi:hypothetical protein